MEQPIQAQPIRVQWVGSELTSQFAELQFDVFRHAHLFSIEALMERIFDVRVPENIEQKFRELAGELAPDPLNPDRLRLNRLLHQTPDLPDRG